MTEGGAVASVWSLRDSRRLALINGPTWPALADPPRILSLSSRGDRALVRWAQGAALWDIDTNRALSTWKIAGAPGALSGNGLKALAANGDRAIRVLDARTGATVGAITLPYPPTALELSHDGQKILVIYNGRAPMVLGVDGRLFNALPVRQAASGQFLPDGERIILRTSDEMSFWRVVSRRSPTRLIKFPGALERLALSRHGSQLVAAGQGRLSLIDLASGRVERTWAYPGEYPSVEFAGEDRLLIVRPQNGETRLYPLTQDVPAALRDLSQARFRGIGVVAAAVSARGLLALGLADTSIVLWDLKAKKQTAAFKGPVNGIATLMFSPKGDLVEATDNLAGRYAWAVRGLRPRPPSDRTSGALVAGGGAGRQGLSVDNDLKVTDVTTGEGLAGLIRLPRPPAASVISERGEVFAGYEDGSIWKWRGPALEDARSLVARIGATPAGQNLYVTVEQMGGPLRGVTHARDARPCARKGLLGWLTN